MEDYNILEHIKRYGEKKKDRKNRFSYEDWGWYTIKLCPNAYKIILIVLKSFVVVVVVALNHVNK